jgi:hypothetical protein
MATRQVQSHQDTQAIGQAVIGQTITNPAAFRGRGHQPALAQAGQVVGQVGPGGPRTARPSGPDTRYRRSGGPAPGGGSHRPGPSRSGPVPPGQAPSIQPYLNCKVCAESPAISEKTTTDSSHYRLEWLICAPRVTLAPDGYRAPIRRSGAGAGHLLCYVPWSMVVTALGLYPPDCRLGSRCCRR